MRTKRLPLLLLLLPLAILGILAIQGYFRDPQVALRELNKRNIPASSARAHQAAIKGELELLELLARADVDLTIPDENGRTPLHHIIREGHLKAISTFTPQRTHYDTRDHEGHSPLSMCLDRGLSDLSLQLIKRGANPNFILPNGEVALPSYYKKKRFEDVSFLLNNKANPNATSLDGEAMLALALQNGDSEIALQLISSGAHPDTLILGEPALISICKNHQKWQLNTEQTQKIIGSLLISGAEYEKTQPDGLRPLQVALQQDCRPAAEILIPRVTNISDCLWLAVYRDNVSAVKALLARKALAEQLDANGDTPLIHAARENKAEILEALLTFGADPNQFGPEGQRALFIALASKSDKTALALLTHPNAANHDVFMESPVSKDFRSLFGRKGYFDWYCRNETGINSLMVAVMMQQLPVVEELLALGVDKFQSSANGVFPIQMAAKNNDVAMQQLLLGVPYGEEEQKRRFVIDLSEQKVRYYRDGELIKTSRISSGRKSHRTPVGEFVITDKTRHKRSNIYHNAPMPYFQRFSCKPIGFHEGNTYSRFASHGCIRLPRATAQFFWKETSLGDRVTIQQ